jgi:predicted dehydrogenase
VHGRFQTWIWDLNSQTAVTEFAGMKSDNKRNSNDPIRVAVVGLGFMGVTHLRAYLETEGANIVAVCDAVRLPVNGVLQGVAGNVKKSDDIHLGPKVRVYRKLEEVLADAEVELVDLCTPTPLHPEQAIASLKSGKNVLCEKPLARTSAAAREIVQTEERSPGFLMPAMCMRFWPGWSWLKQVVAEKRYGAVLAARFRRMSEMPAWSKQGTYTGGNDLGGALFDLHIHDTDFVQFVFGRPGAVFSSGVTRPSGSVDHVVTQYLYPGGPTVYAEGSWLLTKGFNMAYTLHCERATLDFDLARGAEAMQVTEPGQTPNSLKYDGPDGYGEEVRYVVDCARNGRRPATVTAKDGLSALEICEAEEKSIQTGQVVPL